MYKKIASILLSAVLMIGFLPVCRASFASHGARSVTSQSLPFSYKPLPVWKTKVVNGVAKLAMRLDKILPGHRAAEDNDMNGLAIASLCCGVGGLTILPILGAIAAIILGILALNRIRETGQSGRGMAIAGIIMGGVGLLVYGLYAAILLIASL